MLMHKPSRSLKLASEWERFLHQRLFSTVVALFNIHHNLLFFLFVFLKKAVHSYICDSKNKDLHIKQFDEHYNRTICHYSLFGGKIKDYFLYIYCRSEFSHCWGLKLKITESLCGIRALGWSHDPSEQADWFLLLSLASLVIVLYLHSTGLEMREMKEKKTVIGGDESSLTIWQEREGKARKWHHEFRRLVSV